jgi:tripartite-type tricarboxylate transporter receptor subunit TctC
MACLLFTSASAVWPSLVAYRGTGLALNDLIGGHVDFFCEQVVSVAPQIAAGTIKAYAVSSSERLAALLNVPTAKEAGVNYQMSIWTGMFAPKGTPRDIIDKGRARPRAGRPGCPNPVGQSRRLAPGQGRAHAGEVR